MDLIGPTIDTSNSKRASLVHDALYQLMREGILGRDRRKDADDLLLRICLADGMAYLRAGWIYWAVRLFGARHASGRQNRVSAPQGWTTECLIRALLSRGIAGAGVVGL